jgi:hypothetical protein
MELLNLQEAMLLSVVTCICHEDMSVASSAMSLLISLGASPVGLRILYSPTVVHALKGVMAQQDIVRFRVYEVMVCEILNHFQYSWLSPITYQFWSHGKSLSALTDDISIIEIGA